MYLRGCWLLFCAIYLCQISMLPAAATTSNYRDTTKNLVLSLTKGMVVWAVIISSIWGCQKVFSMALAKVQHSTNRKIFLMGTSLAVTYESSLQNSPSR